MTQTTTAVERLEALVALLHAEMPALHAMICNGNAPRAQAAIRVAENVLKFRYLNHPLPQLGPPAPLPPPEPPMVQEARLALARMAERKELATIRENARLEARYDAGLPDQPKISPHFRPEHAEPALPEPSVDDSERLLIETGDIELYADKRGNTTQVRKPSSRLALVP